SGDGADALLLRIALRELVGALEILVRANDQVSDHTIRVLHAAIELGKRAIALEDEEVVVAFVKLVDGVSETTAAPRFFILQRGTCLLGDAAELSGERRGFFLRDLR